MRMLFKSTATTATLFSLAICAFGIQFATTLQMANMSSIYKFLGATTSQLPYLWLAAPISGLIVQPLIGQLSDETSSRFGRRTPYVLICGIGAALALLLMPWSPNIAIAALFLWLLDSSINGCNETLRAITADIILQAEKTKAFALQTLFAGAGATMAAAFPWLVETIFKTHLVTLKKFELPLTIKVSFVVGAVILLISIAYTLIEIQSKPLANGKEVIKIGNISNIVSKIFSSLRHPPEVIKEFYLIQLFTWMGLYCMWLYFSMAISQRFLGLPPHANVGNNLHYQSILNHGTVLTGLFFGFYQIVSMIYALFLQRLTNKYSPYLVYAFSLLAGSLGIISILVYNNVAWIILSMIGVGLMWGSIMTLPYSILAKKLPKNSRGVFLGIFNITITVPQIICALFIGKLTTYFFNNHAVYPFALGGLFIFIAATILIYREYKLKIKGGSWIKRLFIY